MDGEQDIGVAHGGELLALSAALVERDAQAIAQARADLANAMSAEAAVDVIGVASNFERMVRIADATGLELGESLTEYSADTRADLGVARPPQWAADLR